MNHQNHNNHQHHGHMHNMSHGMSHGSARQFLWRFWVVVVLLLPLGAANQMLMGTLGFEAFLLNKYIGFAIASIIFAFSFVFFQHAWHEIKARAYGMMTLVSLAVGAGYLFSAVATFVPALRADFYLEISTLIAVLLFGHYLEARSSSAAGNALEAVVKLLPKKAHRLHDGETEEVAVEDLLEGDIVLVKPGEKVPADGVVLEGAANVDEALISGESKPLLKKEGNEVAAGSICLDGSLRVRLSRVGEHSTVGKIKELLVRAAATKPRSARIADKAAAFLTLAAALTSLGSLLVWSLLIGQSFVFAITLAITVLVIACPHALGLAIPTVTTIATSLAAKNGFFIKDLAKLEVIRNTKQVIFDKTGTLTKGSFGVNKIIALADSSKNEVLNIAASLEQYSSHIIGLSILKYAKDKNAPLTEVNNFQNVAGKGVKGEILGAECAAGNLAILENQKINQDAREAYDSLVNEGQTIVTVAKGEKVLGFIALSDAVKPEAALAVRRLHTMGIKVAMLTGDHEAVAKAVAAELNIDTYFAGVLPEDKYMKVKELQTEGGVVLMVGDGVNDAPALKQADVGIAIGAGTDVAVEAGDVVLTKSDPEDVARLIILSRRVYSKMVQNLVWALGYNVVAIPLAAGVLAPWGIFIRPEIGALVMSLSTAIVVANALLLKRINLG